VSKLHARILRRAGVWAVEDCGSRNGTWVNEMRIAERGLWPGDAVRAGRTVFLYLESGFRAEAWLESASARCWLTGQAGSVQGRNIPLTDKPLLIGRDEVASVRIEDEGIAPFHAQVVITRIGAQLLNLGAPSGVRVNEQEARKVVLADGDVVAVGGARFRFSSAAADAFPPDRRKPPTGARWAEAVRGDKTVIMHETPTPEEDDLDFLPDEETAMDQPGS
jgi:pSer/pThr/pTyr-binding forkhead associated (FHA) protein